MAMINVKFNKIKCRINENGNLELFFINSISDRILYFDGGSFKMIPGNIEMLNDNTYDANYDPSINEIIDIGETEDYDFVLKMNNHVYAKIFYLPNDKYPNGVEQVFMIYKKDDHLHNNIEDDFKNSIIVSIQES
jgi:hypothetical protein